MSARLYRNTLTCLLTLLAAAASVDAQTIIPDRRPIMPPHPPPPWPRPRPPAPMRDQALEVKNHSVNVNIVDAVAVTEIDQLFHNPHNWRVEGTYIFPLEDDVAVSKFSMMINGKEVEGKLLSVEEARRVYESIVAKMRDPALLEYVGKRMFQASIFPIDPDTDARVKLSYTQMLNSDDGLVRYRYPLNTEKYQGSPIATASVLVSIESKTPIKSVFSPTHTLAVTRPSDNKAMASFEGKNIYPDKDFDLFYTLSDKEFGLTVLTYREAGEDGFFLVRLAPPTKRIETDILPKDFCFVLDTSGSMAGTKIEQAREAVKFCLSNLNSEDRFNVIPFSHEPLQFREGLVKATAENVTEAKKFAEEIKATGGTNINDALLKALAAAPGDDESRPYLIVFLTDGLPTIGTTATEEILSNVGKANEKGRDGRVRLFAFGVGHDVNTILLDTLAEQNRGTRDYVQEDEDLELKLSSFYRKVADPVLADLSLSFGDLRTYDMYPTRLTDLFAGSELVAAGRYAGEGSFAIKLTGKRAGKVEDFIFEHTFPRDDRAHDFLPRLWATRKVGYLMDEIRLHGENKELKDTIVQLATRYGIITPYTSYLVTEPGADTYHAGAEQFRMLRRSVGGPPPMPMDGGRGGAARMVRGKSAVEQSLEAAQLGAADADLRLDTRLFVEGERERGRENQRTVEYVGTRTFYWDGQRWIDGSFTDKMGIKKVELFSEEYFKLVREHPELAKCFALGDRVVVVLDGVAYETVPPPEPEPEQPAEPSNEKDKNKP